MKRVKLGIALGVVLVASLALVSSASAAGVTATIAKLGDVGYQVTVNDLNAEPITAIGLTAANGFVDGKEGFDESSVAPSSCTLNQPLAGALGCPGVAAGSTYICYAGPPTTTVYLLVSGAPAPVEITPTKAPEVHYCSAPGFSPPAAPPVKKGTKKGHHKKHHKRKPHTKKPTRAARTLPKSSATLIVPNKSIGGVALGAISTSVQKAWGHLAECEFDCLYEGPKHGTESPAIARVGLETGASGPPKVWNVFITVGTTPSGDTVKPNFNTPLTAFKTKKGIGLGSTVAELKADYHAVKKEGSSAGGVYTYVLSGPKESQTLFTSIGGRKITTIAIQSHPGG